MWKKDGIVSEMQLIFAGGGCCGGRGGSGGGWWWRRSELVMKCNCKGCSIHSLLPFSLSHQTNNGVGVIGKDEEELFLGGFVGWAVLGYGIWALLCFALLLTITTHVSSFHPLL